MALAVCMLGITAPHASAHSEMAGSGTAQFALTPVYYDPNEPATRSYFIFDAIPGKVIQNQVRVTNTGTAKGTAQLYPVDATTGQTSGAVYLSGDAPRQDVGGWLTLDTASVTLAPGESQIVHFQLLAPESARSGQHVGGIVAASATSQTSNDASAIHIRVQNLTVIGVLVNLPGARTDGLQASGVTMGAQDGYQLLMLGLTNTGNALLKPFGELTVRNSQGNLLYQLPLKLDTLVPVTSIAYPIYLKGPKLDPGSYKVGLELHYGDPEQTLVYTTLLAVTTQQAAQTSASHTSAVSGADVLAMLQSGNPFIIGGAVLTLAGAATLLFALGLLAGRRRANRSMRQHRPQPNAARFR